jgi:hypothetical protein
VTPTSQRFSGKVDFSTFQGTYRHGCCGLTLDLGQGVLAEAVTVALHIGTRDMPD